MVANSGSYRVGFDISYTAGIGASMAIAVNGTVDASTDLPALTSVGQLHGSAILTLAAGDVITLRNNSAVALTMALSPSVGAQITVEQLD